MPSICLICLPICLSYLPVCLSLACEGDDDAHPRRAQPGLDGADEGGADAAAGVSLTHREQLQLAPGEGLG